MLSQNRIIEKLKDKSENFTDKGEYNTPLAPGYLVTRPKLEDLNILNPEEQKYYRSAIGSLMYLVRLSKPELSNPVRELSKVMDRGTIKHLKALKRMVKYVILNDKRGMNIKPNENIPWEIEVFADSDFCGDRESRKSITGYIILLNKIPLSWKSEAQNNVSLSSAEAEYVAVSEGVRETKFVADLLDSINMEY